MRSVKCLVADGSITAGATTDRVLVVAMDSLNLTGLAYFIQDLENALTSLLGVPDWPGAIGVLNDSVSRCDPEGVFDEHAIGGQLSGVTRIRPGLSRIPRFYLNRGQPIRSFHQIVWLPCQAITLGHQRAFEIAAPIGVLIDNTAIRKPTIQDLSPGASPRKEGQ